MSKDIKYNMDVVNGLIDFLSVKSIYKMMCKISNKTLKVNFIDKNDVVHITTKQEDNVINITQITITNKKDYEDFKKFYEGYLND